MSKNIYFLSDAHLGSRAIKNSREQELILVQFLNSIKEKAKEIYLMGDMFDFWFEFKNVVPKGFTRFLGKLSELTDSGIKIHFFIGNHDLWCQDYLEQECGVTIHRDPKIVTIGNKKFYLAHGDGLGDPDWKFKILRSMFHNRFLRFLFASIHPRWSLSFGLNWAKHSREKRVNGLEPEFQGEKNEHLIIYSKALLEKKPDINFFIYGHRHIMLDLMIRKDSRVVILGDWINHFSYAVFDGEHLFLDQYIQNR